MIQDNGKRQPKNTRPSDKERNAPQEHPETSAAEEKTGKRISDQTSQEPKALADGTSPLEPILSEKDAMAPLLADQTCVF